MNRRRFFGAAIGAAASLTFGLNSPKPLQAKKLTCLIRVPNELLRFASPVVEALLREDLTKNLALNLDLQFMKA